MSTRERFQQNDCDKERERKRVQEFLGSINPNEKSIVFCANQAHAAMVRDLINQESDSSSVDYCVRVTAKDGLLETPTYASFRTMKNLSLPF